MDSTPCNSVTPLQLSGFLSGEAIQVYSSLSQGGLLWFRGTEKGGKGDLWELEFLNGVIFQLSPAIHTHSL